MHRRLLAFFLFGELGVHNKIVFTMNYTLCGLWVSLSTRNLSSMSPAFGWNTGNHAW